MVASSSCNMQWKRGYRLASLGEGSTLYVMPPMRDKPRVTALECVIAHGMERVVDYLLARYRQTPTDDNSPAPEGRVFLVSMHYVALCYNYPATISMIRKLRDAGVGVGTGAPHTPLAFAWAKERTELVKKLIMAGAPYERWPETEDEAEDEDPWNLGRSPLELAAERGLLDEMKLLLDLGNVDIEFAQGDEWGRTALIMAGERGDLECLKLLLASGANSNAMDRGSRAESNARSMTVAHYTLSGAGWDDGPAQRPWMERKCEFMRILLEHGANLGFLDSRGISSHRLQAQYHSGVPTRSGVVTWEVMIVLALARGKSSPRFIRELCAGFEDRIGSGRVPLAKNASLLHLACGGLSMVSRRESLRQYLVIKYLLDCIENLEVDAVTSNLKTPLMVAAQPGMPNNFDAISLLLSHGADPYLSLCELPPSPIEETYNLLQPANGARFSRCAIESIVSVSCWPREKYHGTSTPEYTETAPKNQGSIQLYLIAATFLWAILTHGNSIMGGVDDEEAPEFLVHCLEHLLTKSIIATKNFERDSYSDINHALVEVGLYMAVVTQLLHSGVDMNKPSTALKKSWVDLLREVLEPPKLNNDGDGNGSIQPEPPKCLLSPGNMGEWARTDRRSPLMSWARGCLYEVPEQYTVGFEKILFRNLAYGDRCRWDDEMPRREPPPTDCPESDSEPDLGDERYHSDEDRYNPNGGYVDFVEDSEHWDTNSEMFDSTSGGEDSDMFDEDEGEEGDENEEDDDDGDNEDDEAEDTPSEGDNW
ncbi:ankyrin repeat-containing domain protein [Podospora australis]|uniref:Ankyrin repeat-containing domain protein n=1 Tax=Podospora australis TaxID=1536484 RepID=A0AAN6X1T0_9PEZI|nr:ankyrin repeat-containing domain protein [Podospora australis]